MKLDDLPVFLMTEQPETCSECGTRAHFETITKAMICVCPSCFEVWILEDEN